MAEMTGHIWFGPEAIATACGHGEATVSAIKSYGTGLKYSERYGLVLGEIDQKPELAGYTQLESLLITQIGEVLEKSGLSLEKDDVQLVISSTKGNVGLLEGNTENVPDDAYLYETAKKIGAHFSASKSPILISNACISGVSAAVVARRMILTGRCRHAIVAGCDVLNEFITSGFASFKSLSDEVCRPYDASRKGLNLAEACACYLLTSDKSKATAPYIRLSGGSVTNDANHISGPSRTGDGLYFAIRNAMEEAGITAEEVGFVNTHGTATAYNDEMESKAIALADLSDKPLNSLKSYVGHTLGASGVVETLICLYELRNNVVFGVKGYKECGVPCPVNITEEHRPLEVLRCIKTASGFGGCNAAIAMVADEYGDNELLPPKAAGVEETARYSLPQSELPFGEMIRQEYRALEAQNLKFFKMSDLCKGAYIAAENLIRQNNICGKYRPEEIGVIMANSSASLDTDVEHQRILEQHLPEGTSPAVFVYTLPSVAAGEVCIRHKIQGDNTFFISDDAQIAEDYARSIIERGYIKAAICGWCDKMENNSKVELKIFELKS